MSKSLPRFNRAIAVSLISVSLATVTANPAKADNASASSSDYSFLVTADWRNCTQMGTEYVEVYAFETPSYYVNICSKGDRFFYSGEAKQGYIDSIFLPAYLLEDGHTYRADNGNLSYFIAMTSSEGMLSVEQNGHQIVVERSLSQNCYQADEQIGLISTQPGSNSQKTTLLDRARVNLVQLDEQTNSSTHEDTDKNLWVQISALDSELIFNEIKDKPTTLMTCASN
ncbi:hypothetical protein IQ238_16935 [Pleurocapsales cyanobacterium LEGE 06147]|nr:hypothetical protein [Pleurocapsales cyanobacterium LEGE 06147]